MFKNKKDIFYHVSKSSADKLKEYLLLDDDLNFVDKNGCTALMTCLNIRWGNIHSSTSPENILSIANALIASGIDIDATDYSNSTALIHAASIGDVSVAKILIEAGANIFAKDDSDRDALEWALIYEHGEIVDMLQRKKLEIENHRDDIFKGFATAVKRDLPKLK